MPNGSRVPVLVPDGKTAVDLTMGELDAASFHLKADVSDCLAGDVPGRRYAAMIEIAYRWAKRTDPKATRDTFRDYTSDDMSHALRWDVDDVDPTAVAPDSDSSESP